MSGTAHFIYFLILGIKVKKINTTRFILYQNEIYLAGDLVYMGDERLLDEYILNDVGKIWIGPKNSSRGREWVFGQFDACVLPAIMLMCEMSQMAYHRYIIE